MNAMSLHHTSFTVADLDESVAWYEGIGCTVEASHLIEGAWLDRLTGLSGCKMKLAFLSTPGVRDVLLELIEYLAPSARASAVAPNIVGSGHIAFQVDDVEGAVAKFATHGVNPLASPVFIEEGPFSGNTVVYLSRGRGELIELTQPEHFVPNDHV